MLRSIVTGVFALLLAAPLLAREIDSVVKVIPGTQADFTQRFIPKGFTKAQVERGTVTFGVLPKMRWSYGGSEPRLFIFDGQKSWLYTPAEKQVQVVTLDAAKQKSVPFAFLWNGAALRDYSYSEKRKGKNVEVTMKAVVPNAEFRQVNLIIDATTHSISRVDYSDRSGNRTAFEFAGYRKAALNAGTFAFQPPAGVEVVEN
jgi:chaperone LolA